MLNSDIQRLVLRPAIWEDRDVMLDWRNDPIVRLNSENSERLARDDHERWLVASLQNSHRVLLIGEQKNNVSTMPVGVLRYDFSPKDATKTNLAIVSIYLNPEVAGNGFGTQLLKLGTDWLKQFYPTITEIQARIKSENIASIRAFEKAGYCRVELFTPPLLTYALKIISS